MSTPSAAGPPQRFLTVNPAFFVMAFATGATGTGGMTRTVIWMAVVFVSVLVHECGHALVARAFGHAPWIVLHGMGGTTYWKRIENTRPGPYILISLAGPFAGFALGALVLAASRMLPWPTHDPLWQSVLRDMLWANFGWGVINLLPIVPLDGGHVLQTILGALFGPRAARGAIYVSIGAAGLIAAFSIYAGTYFNAILAAYFIMGNVRTLQAASAVAAVATATTRAPTAPTVVLPTAHDASEAIARGDGESAERIAKSLIAHAPGRAERSYPATLLAYAYLLQGRYREARSIAETMLEPPGDDYLVGRLMLHAGELEEGTARMRSAFENRPHAASGYWLIEALIWQRRIDELEVLATGPSTAAIEYAALFDASAALFYNQRFDAALGVSTAMFERWKRPSDAYNAACSLAQLGRLDDALDWLTRAVDAGWSDLDGLDTDEDLHALRALPGFAPLRVRVASRSELREK